MSRRPRIFPYPWKKRRPPTHLRGHMDELHPLEPNQTGAVGSTGYAGYGPFDDLRLQGCIKFTHGDHSPRHICWLEVSDLVIQSSQSPETSPGKAGLSKYPVKFIGPFPRKFEEE
ncbi:hypothetical protein TESG_06834 [Trichophyton tonsurans CBS 112818]|uniref:Uncharacterized protein n=2 Tax=Trichophyton TaxID=5550 RepID=F2PZ52_TRIEC|nr:hypothetical protein TESG_06834 [Trichophyton tonsurans CBS 112818]EGE07170.1 hypothetical protein TEQG_06157 [Trichophyton equinum CBS 127.97]